MRMLVVSGYPAWYKVSKQLMPSNHLFGVHELVDHYEEVGESIRGILRQDVFGGGYVDFYLWKSGKKNIISQVLELKKKSTEYDLIFDQLNRCSIFLGIFKKLGLFKTKLLTVLHHPPYDLQLCVSESEAYIFFNEDYRCIAEKANPNKKNRYYVNEWRPDMNWYSNIVNKTEEDGGDIFYIDTGKSRRDRRLLVEAAEKACIRVDYAADQNGEEGYARPYAIDLKDDVGMVKRILKYKAQIIPVQENKKHKIGPLGITSFMDCLALGRPVIASDNVCFADIIEKYGLGVLYKTGDVDSLEQKMKLLYNNPDLFMLCKNNIRNYAKKTMDDYSIKLTDIINRFWE